MRTCIEFWISLWWLVTAQVWQSMLTDMRRNGHLFTHKQVLRSPKLKKIISQTTLKDFHWWQYIIVLVKRRRVNQKWSAYAFWSGSVAKQASKQLSTFHYICRIPFSCCWYWFHDMILFQQNNRWDISSITKVGRAQKCNRERKIHWHHQRLRL